MSPRNPDEAFWRGRRVLITGHTGFKGAWLARWLAAMRADVHGIALDPPTRPSLFESARVSAALSSDQRVDIRDASALGAAVAGVAPSVVLHLAAQPLVRDGYRRPSETISTNAAGAVNLLEAARSTSGVQGIVVITTDKVYLPSHVGPEHSEHPESPSGSRTRPHREDDRLGGLDPYAVSKVMAELAVEVFRALPAIDGRPGWSIPLATARAGNVVGGGDWSTERLVPDAIRAFESGETLRLRFPDAIRPWQHVLEPLCGYLLLAEALVTSAGAQFDRAFNFGPQPDGESSVGELAASLAARWGAGAHVVDSSGDAPPYENPVLRLDSGLARDALGWAPRWDIDRTVRATVDWYRNVAGGGDPAEETDRQIAEYLATVRP